MIQTPTGSDTYDDPDLSDDPSADSVGDALAVFGLQQVDDAPHVAEPVATHARKFYLWPCHAAVFRLWCAVQTQWRYRPAGMAGSVPYGLDYAGVDSARRGLRIGRRAYADMFAALQTMERAAAAVYARQFAQELAKQAGD